MDVKLLKSKMILSGEEDFVKSIARILDITRQTASAKLNCESDFTQHEIAIIAKHYCLNDEEIRKIFIEGDSNNDSKRSSEVVG